MLIDKEAKMTNAYHSIFDLLLDQAQICRRWFSLCARIDINEEKK
jgi:hypothetical protein